VFCVSCYALVLSLKIVFDILFTVTFKYGEMNHILPHVTQDAKNGRKCLKMAYTGIIASPMADCD
jgi:hypothetical protein